MFFSHANTNHNVYLQPLIRPSANVIEDIQRAIELQEQQLHVLKGIYQRLKMTPSTDVPEVVAQESPCTPLQ